MAACVAAFYVALGAVAAFFGLDPAPLGTAVERAVGAAERAAPDASAWDGLRQILQQWQFTTEYAVVVGDVRLASNVEDRVHFIFLAHPRSPKVATKITQG